MFCGGIMFYRNKIRMLADWKDLSTRKPIILQGARQVGKTYLLKTFGRENFKRIHYFNFEEDGKLASIFKLDLKPQRILDDLGLYNNQAIQKEDLIIFDEIQSCPLAITSLKYFCESMPKGFLAAAGSLLGLHMNASFPVGKVSFIDLHPLSFKEFLLALDYKDLHDKLEKECHDLKIPEAIHSTLWKLLKTYFVVGGMPEAVAVFKERMGSSVDAFQIVRKLQKDLITSYTNDIAKHSGKFNAMNIERVWRSVPSQLSSSLDGSAKKYRFKDVLSGQKSFRDLSGPIDWLKKAGIVLQVKIANSGQRPSEAYTKDNRFKLLFHDIGLLGACAEIPAKMLMSWDFGTYKGYFAENYVGQQFSSLGFPLYSWEEGTAEIEFLLGTNHYNVPIEVKSGHVVKAKSLLMFDKKYSPRKSVVFSAKMVDISQPSKLRLPLYLAPWISNIL